MEADIPNQGSLAAEPVNEVSGWRNGGQRDVLVGSVLGTIDFIIPTGKSSEEIRPPMIN